METEPGTVVHLKTGDGEWLKGVFLALIEEAGNSYYVLDIGRPAPRKVNAAFVLEIEEEDGAELIDLKKEVKKRMKVLSNGQT